MFKISRNSLLTAFLIPLLWLANTTVTAKPLVLGKVSDNPKKHYMYLKPMVDYMADRMADLGITEGKVLMARDNQQMIDYLKAGKVDWVTETPMSAAIFHEKAGAEYLVRKWKKGVSSYYTVFFTRKDSGINSLADLKGKSIAFEDPGSTSAFFIPAAILIQQGLKLTRLGSPRDKPPVDKVGYTFSGEEVNTTSWVHMKLADVGVYNNLDWENDEHNPPQYRKNMHIIHKSKRFPRAIELVRNDLDDRIKQRLKTILLDMHKDPSTKRVLRAYQKTKKFDALDAQSLEALKQAAELTRIVEAKLK